MSARNFGIRQVRAVRLLRSGSTSDQVCRSLRLPLESLRSLEIACQNVPDDILARLEQALSENEKLRRLVAGLGYSASEAESGESG
jgi:hypothetical protein